MRSLREIPSIRLLGPLAALFITLAGCAGNNQSCGDGKCQISEGENSTTCPGDCPSVCGDGSCSGTEDNAHCPQDCALGCGDGVCGASETNAKCPKDCPPVCGDGVCNGTETAETCQQDCPLHTCNDTCSSMCGGCSQCCADGGGGLYCVSAPHQCP